MLDTLQTGLRRGTERTLRWLRRRNPSCGDLGEPLFFHHVAKTGGTSLISAIRGMTLPGLTFSEDGNLSAGFVSDLVASGLMRGQFIYGHPHAAAALPLRGRCAIITLLREPCDQVISSYLHIRSHDTVPDHRLARQLSFREFLLARPYYAIFQIASLHVGIEERPLERVEDLIDRLPQILAYLGEINFVGTLDSVVPLLTDLATTMRWPSVPSFPHRRKSRLSSRRRLLIEEQFAELQCHPKLAPLFAAEREMFNRVREIESSS